MYICACILRVHVYVCEPMHSVWNLNTEVGWFSLLLLPCLSLDPTLTNSARPAARTPGSPHYLHSTGLKVYVLCQVSYANAGMEPR